MSRRTAEADKAIRLAWERERDLVQEGKGTRNWTKEQQEDILNPEIGKAYDEKGRAFEGQHMRSVAEYPEYQGNPDNIQFLNRDEHLEAHKGSWKNSTNWFYNPETKEFIDFGEGEIIPCKIIELSEPVAINIKAEKDIGQESMDDKENVHATLEPTRGTPSSTEENLKKTLNQPISPKLKTKDSGFIKGMKTIGNFIVEHPLESLEIAGVVVRSVASFASSISNRSKRKSGVKSENAVATDFSSKTDIASAVSEIVENATRKTPHENEVSAHKQRYHTKDGIVWRDKSSYQRNKKNNGTD